MFSYNMLRIGMYKHILSVVSIVNRKSSNRKSLHVSTGNIYFYSPITEEHVVDVLPS